MNNPTNPTPSPELLPCPFCGDPMEFGIQGWFGHTDPDRCDCPLAIQDYPPADLVAWNTRTSPRPPSADVVEKLRALRHLCECGGQPFYVEIIDEVLAALPTHSNDAVEALHEARAFVANVIREHGDIVGSDPLIQRLDAALSTLSTAAPQGGLHDALTCKLTDAEFAEIDQRIASGTAAPTTDATAAMERWESECPLPGAYDDSRQYAVAKMAHEKRRPTKQGEAE